MAKLSRTPGGGGTGSDRELSCATNESRDRLAISACCDQTLSGRAIPRRARGSRPNLDLSHSTFD